jgi:hypothetical protein
VIAVAGFVILVAVVGGAIALAAASDRRGRVVMVVAVIGGVLVVLTAPLGLVLGDIRNDHDRDDSSPATTTVSEPTTTTMVLADAPAPPTRDADVTLSAVPDGSAPTPSPVVSLPRGRTTALVKVAGVGRDVSGRMYACRSGECFEAVPVRSDSTGVAHAVLPLDPALARCATAADGCVLVIDTGRRTIARIASRDAARGPRLDVEPTSGVRAGDEVRVALEAFPRDASVAVAQCGPVRNGEPGCSAHGLVLTTDGDGRATTQLTISGGRGDRADGGCRRGTRCYIVVRSGDGLVLATSSQLRLAATATADYDGARVAGGLALAALLGSVAVLLLRTTNWRAVGLPSTTDDAPDPEPEPFTVGT